MSTLWMNTWEYQKHPLSFLMFDSKDDLQAAYWRDPTSVPLAVIFEDPKPISRNLQ